MAPRLNQLSLCAAARSFLDPDADTQVLATGFHERLFGPAGRELVPLPRPGGPGPGGAPLPTAEEYRQELLFRAGLFAELSGPAPAQDRLRQRYRDRVCAIGDRLPPHVDPRPRQAADRARLDAVLAA